MTPICSMVELAEKSKLYKNVLSKQTLRISICAGMGCIANGSQLVYDKFLEIAKDNKLDLYDYIEFILNYLPQ